MARRLARTGIPLFRARSKAKEFRAQLDELRRCVDWLNLLSTIELEERKVTLRQRAARVLLRDVCRGQDAVGRACRRPAIAILPRRRHRPALHRVSEVGTARAVSIAV